MLFDNKEKYSKGMRGKLLKKDGNLLRPVTIEQANYLQAVENQRSIYVQTTTQPFMGQSGSVATTFNNLSFYESANMTLPGPAAAKFAEKDSKSEAAATSKDFSRHNASKSERKDQASQVDDNIAVEVFIKGSQVHEGALKDAKRKTVQIPKRNRNRKSKGTVPTEPIEDKAKSSLYVQAEMEDPNSPTRFKIYEFTDNPEFTKQASSTKKYDLGDSLKMTKKDSFSSGFAREPRLKSIMQRSS